VLLATLESQSLEARGANEVMIPPRWSLHQQLNEAEAAALMLKLARNQQRQWKLVGAREARSKTNFKRKRVVETLKSLILQSRIFFNQDICLFF